MRIPAADRLVAFLGYVPFLFLVPILGRRDSLFAQFHGRQSMVLWFLWLIPTLILFVVLWILGPGLSALLFGAIFVLFGLYLVYSLIGMFKSATRERYRMPIVADVALHVFRL